MTNEPDPEVEREKLMRLIEQRLPHLADAPYRWPDWSADDHPGGWFQMMSDAIDSQPVFEGRFATGSMPRMGPSDLRIGWFNGA